MDTKASAKFVGSIPYHYDHGLGPHIFMDYAQDLAKRVVAAKPSTVLELAAGTGIVSRELRNVLSPQTDLLVSDLNPPMLEIARDKFSADEAVRFAQINAMETGFDDQTFDVITCQFGVMFFPNKIDSFLEARRILKPDGRYIFSTWGSMDDNPFSKIAHYDTSTFFPEQSPPSFYKVPFSYHDPKDVINDLRHGGFESISHHAVSLEKPILDFALFARGLVHGNPLIDEIRALNTIDENDVVAHLEAKLREAFSTGIMPLTAHVFEAS